MPLEFGVSLTPAAAEIATIREITDAGEELGLHLLGVQDHPYQRRFFDTWTLMGDLLARTERLRVVPDVANLPLRPPAVMAKAAVSLDLLSGGRFELGLGAGAFWDGVAAMGGPRRSARESVDALEEAIEVIRLVWSPECSVSYAGEHYRLDGFKPGPAPAHAIGIWLGAYRPRMLGVVGRRADGWVPSLAYSSPEALPNSNRRIDEAAAGAGRDPGEIRRLLNVSGAITDGSRGERPLDGPPEHWAEALAGFARDGFDGFVLWPSPEGREQVERFTGEVVPRVREATGDGTAGN
jgi:alkanesulfonate monooxygenase SsuD/methylene tetrahydromethanopterin reductase-like flavin-dependent oxidoreductase (luciferase family)